MLAVECDGARYHSALWARERDRLRQEVLEGMGWRFHRIWSTDWFYRRESEVVRLRQALQEASLVQGPVWLGTNETPLAPAPGRRAEPAVYILVDSATSAAAHA